MIWIHRIIFLAIFIYVMLATAAFSTQRKMLYFPPNFYNPPPVNMIEVRTDPGGLGWYSPAQEGRPTVMVFRGNASSFDTLTYIYRDLQAAGYGVWAVGYPGYPGMKGTPTQAHLAASAQDQFDKLSEIGVENIVFYGTSLGSGVAAQLAAEREPQLLILDAPFNSVLDMSRKHMPILPIGLLLKDKWQSDDALEGLDVPLIWIHGTEDRVIPISQGRKLYDGYAGSKSAHIIPGANHINTWHNGGRDAVLTALEKL